MNDLPVSTALAKTKLAEPENVFMDYPLLAFVFFQLLLLRMPESTTPLDFALRFEEALDDVKARPEEFGHVKIFVSTMRLGMSQIAERLFDEQFGKAVEALMHRSHDKQKGE